MSLLLLPWQVCAETASPDDLFEALDNSLEEEFLNLDAELEAQYQALDEALEAAFQRVEKEVAAVWGEGEVELPTKQKWVDYSDDMATRRQIDFEQGQVLIEQIVEGDISDSRVSGALARAAADLSADTTSDLSERDLVLKYAKEALAAEDLSYARYAPDDSQAVVGSLIGAPPGQPAIEAAIARAKAGSPADEGAIRTSISTTANGKQKVSVQVPFRFGYQATLASRYQQLVMQEARSHDLDPSLIYAVMQTESSFNPRARSSVPAFGLMQLVPRSGAMDAYQFVYGEKVLLDPEYLYDPARNVELGAAYLSLLNTRYLRAIENPESRLICAIAAYNTGAGNVSRAFTGGTRVRDAARVINSMTPDEVFEHLKVNLPYEETRRYIEKVTRARKQYQGLDKMVGIEVESIRG
ncbi:MAG: murein transglycosylase domain-containing protein [Pseudomonadota bacterium]